MFSHPLKRAAYALQLLVVVGTMVIIPQTASATAFGDFDFSTNFPSTNFPELDLDEIEFGENSSSVSISTKTECKVFASTNRVDFNGSVNIRWETTGFDNITVNGQAFSNLNGDTTFDNLTTDTDFVLVATNDNGDRCQQTVTVACDPPPVIYGCTDPHALNYDEHATKDDDSCKYPEPVCEDSAASNTGGALPCVYPEPPVCEDPKATNTGHPLPCEYPEPAPVCVDFTATPGSITRGEEVTLNWEVTNTTSLGLNNAIGDVTGIDTFSVSPLTSTTYILEVFGTNGRKVQCEAPVIVIDPTSPAITIDKRDPADGDDTQAVAPNGTAAFEITVTNTGNEALVNVAVTDALEPTCDQTIGSLAIGASETYTCNSTNVTSAFTNVAIVTGDSAVDGETVTDTDSTDVTITIVNTPVFTCTDNVTFSASDTAIDRGDASLLTWNVTDADSVSISGINATTLTGTQSVSPTSDTTYTLTAEKTGFTPIQCPVTIDVSTGGGGGGGGGGSASPRCEFEISASTISSGERVTLTWETRSATEMTITDDRGNVIVTTEDRLARDKEEFLDGEITVRPTRNTTYTLLAERGSRDRECSVEVEVEADDIVILEVRDQAPLVAGISLSEVPHTGFEAGPLMTSVFYTLLIGWALYLTYVLVIPKTVFQTVPVKTLADREDTLEQMQTAEARRPDAFSSLPAVSQVTASVTAVATAPMNLPVAPVGFATAVVAPAPVTAPTMAAQATASTPVDVAALEAIAHNNQALLSSDAIQTFINAVPANEQLTKIVAVVKSAQAQFPLEDSWVVINNDRMTALLVA